MIKIKIEDTDKYVSINQKRRNYSALEFIILLDLAIEALKEDFKLSDDEIGKLLESKWILKFYELVICLNSVMIYIIIYNFCI